MFLLECRGSRRDWSYIVTIIIAHSECWGQEKVVRSEVGHQTAPLLWQGSPAGLFTGQKFSFFSQFNGILYLVTSLISRSQVPWYPWESGLRSQLNEMQKDGRLKPLSRMKRMRSVSTVHHKDSPWRQGAKWIPDGVSVLETSREDKPPPDMYHCQIEEVAGIRKS